MNKKNIEEMTQSYAIKFNELRDRVEALNWEIEEIKNKHIGNVRVGVSLVKSAESALKKAIIDCEDCFVKPKTLVLHGIKVGWQKKKGTINFAENSIDLIKKNLPDKKSDLIISKEVISKASAKTLTVKEMASVGGEVVLDKDEVIIKNMDTAVDKLVGQLLKSDQDIVL